MLRVWCDASIEPFNPAGIGAWAFIVKRGEEIIHQDVAITGWGPKVTNNVMEYNAVIAALLWLIKLPEKEQIPVIIFSDSQLIVNQCTGRYGCGAAHLVPKLEVVKKAVNRYKRKVVFKWIPREKNQEADALSRTLYTEKALKLAKERRLDIEWEGDDVPW